MSRGLPAGRGLLARIAKAASGPLGQEDAGSNEAGQDEARIREAFLAAEGIAPAAPRRRIRPLDTATQDAAPTSAAAASQDPATSPVDASPSGSDAAASLSAFRVARADPPDPATLARPSADEPLRSADEPPVSGPPNPGESAPDHLLRVPRSASGSADAFFEGLVRRVEDR